LVSKIFNREKTRKTRNEFCFIFVCFASFRGLNSSYPSPPKECYNLRKKRGAKDMKKLCILILSLACAFSAFAQTKTVTNSDLEKFRQQRIESERKLKERYAEMGFPSPAQIERQNAERRAEMEQYSDQLREQRIYAQNDIIAQANALRTQIADVEAQINYLRNQGGAYYNQPYIYSYGYAPYVSYRGGRSGYGYAPNGWRGGGSTLAQISRLPPNMRTVQEYAAMYPSSQSIYNQSIGNVRIGGGGRIGGYGGGIGYGRGGNYRGGNYRGGYVAPYVGGGYYGNDASQQLIYLEQQRAGLLAQWNLLEEQARRAGIRLD